MIIGKREKTQMHPKMLLRSNKRRLTPRSSGRMHKILVGHLVYSLQLEFASLYHCYDISGRFAFI